MVRFPAGGTNIFILISVRVLPLLFEFVEAFMKLKHHILVLEQAILSGNVSS